MKCAMFILAFLLPMAFAQERVLQRFDAISPSSLSANNQNFLPAELAFQSSAWLENSRRQ